MPELMLSMVPPIVVGIVTVQFLIRKRWRASAQWARIWLVVVVLWLIVGRNSVLRRIVLYQGRNATTYGSGFHAEVFRAMPIGTPAEVVVRKLGQPLESETDPTSDEVYLRYSERKPGGKPYWNEIVVLDRTTQRVKEKIDEFMVQ